LAPVKLLILKDLIKDKPYFLQNKSHDNP